MATIDIIILAMIGVGVIMGLIKGFNETDGVYCRVDSRIADGSCLVWHCCRKVGAGSPSTSTTVAQVLAFILIWIAVPLGFAFVASLLTKALDAVHTGWLNRWLGNGLGTWKYMILIGVSYSCDRIYRSEQ